MTHSLIGLAAGAVVARKKMPKKFWALSAVLPALPDADVLGFKLGIPYMHAFGHRGFYHSLPFALVLGMAAAALFFRDGRLFSQSWWRLALYFFLITASHGVLDTFTNGGLGIALLSPFSNHRFFMPWTPIEVAPLGIARFFSERGWSVMKSEFLWVWLPALAMMAYAKIKVFVRPRR